MKIAIFSDTFYPQVNGVSYFALYMAENLGKRGHQVKVFTATLLRNAGLDPKNLGFELVNVPSLPAPIYRGQGFRMTVPAGWTYKKLKKFNPDIIYTHTPFAIGLEAVRGSRKLKIPLIGEHHTFYDHYLKHIRMDYDWAKKMSWKITVGYYNKCDLVISPSKSLADTLSEEGLKKPIRIIPNGVDTDLFVPMSADQKETVKKSHGIDGLSVVYMGRVSYEKSIDKAIGAFAKFLKNGNNKNVKLMIIGDGPDRKKLEDLAKKLKIEKNIIWTGILRGKDLAAATGCNDVFITASKSENAPLSVLEAMACGLPLVAAGEKGLKELVKDGENGCLCQADDEIEMSQKLEEILGNKLKREECSKVSRELALNYSKDKIMQLFEECFSETINNYKLNK